MNCNESHPANYRGCPKAKEYMLKKKSNRNPGNNNRKCHYKPHVVRSTQLADSQQDEHYHMQKS